MTRSSACRTTCSATRDRNGQPLNNCSLSLFQHRSPTTTVNERTIIIIIVVCSALKYGAGWSGAVVAGWVTYPMGYHCHLWWMAGDDQ